MPLFRILLVLLLCSAFFNAGKHVAVYDPPFKTQEKSWADSIIQTLSPDEKIGQLFMVAAWSDKNKKHVNEIDSLIVHNKIGGLIFFQGGPVRQARLCNRYQSESRVPLLISMDAEWGLSMRLDSTIVYPHQMMLGAMQDDSLVYEMGREIARQCKRLGVHVNLAPVADVNNNPNNPVINTRSFGENKYNVARKAVMYMKGLQDGGVLANGKHFPGHGDTEQDSHKTLPVMNHSLTRMDTLELYPFREMIKYGLGSMMVAHLNIPAYDTTANIASTLSKKIVTDLLKNEMGFRGLIFTDALNMKGVSNYFDPGVVDVKALLAGNDVLLFSADVPKAIDAIKVAIARGEISWEDIEARCLKILKAKEWCGLNKYKPVKTENLYEDLNTMESNWVNRKLVENAITLLKNENNIIPIRRPDTMRIATVALGSQDLHPFQEMMEYYANVKHFNLSKEPRKVEVDSLFSQIGNFNMVVVSFHNYLNNFPDKNFGVTQDQLDILDRLLREKNVILDFFSNPYLLARIDSLDRAKGIIMSYEPGRDIGEVSAMALFGAVQFKGKVPVSPCALFPVGTGIMTSPYTKLKITDPEELGIKSSEFASIDSIVYKGIRAKAYPGCQVLIAKDGKILYYKSYGYHTYQNKYPVRNTDIYDLASLTKVLSSTPAVMKTGIDINKTLEYYLGDLSGTNKSNIVIRDMMTHQAGLKEWIPFWMRTVKKGVNKPGVYSKTQSDKYPYRVAEKMFINKSWKDSIWKEIVNSPVKDDTTYRYSDLGYYFLQAILEKRNEVTLDKYVRDNFYYPMGLPTMGYKPRERFSLDRIPPTEYDAKFRKQLVWGDVHDQGAAMMGGVAGHAGLFADAMDVAAMMQMFMSYGVYGGQRYIDSSVVAEFTGCPYCPQNRRGVGFDKPETDPMKDNPVCDCVSPLSFGHSGFTGTFAWADPKTGIVYVFLSNRVYPDAEVNKLARMGTRTAIQQEIYRILANK